MIQKQWHLYLELITANVFCRSIQSVHRLELEQSQDSSFLKPGILIIISHLTLIIDLS